MDKLISANILLEHVKDIPTWWADEGGYYGGAMKYPEGMFECDDIINSIKNALAVDPARYGKWIDEGAYVTTAYGSLNVYKCSNCKNDITIDDFDNYCPACGAKMDLE